MDVTNKLPLRLRAAGWTAAVAVIPAYASARYVVDTKTAEHIGFQGLTNVPALTAMAVVAAVIPSYFLCWRLLDYEQYHHGPTAAGTGIVTCLLAYLLLACMVVSIDLVLGAQAGYLADESPSGLVGLVAVGLFVFLYGSLVITGWFTLPLSALVAYLVSLMYRGGG
jgi:hypothetical protein